MEFAGLLGVVERQRERGRDDKGLTARLAAGLNPGVYFAKLLQGATVGDRRLLELLFIERLSYSEIAALLRVPEGTLKTRVFRCRVKVLKVWRRLTATDGGTR